MGSLCSDAGKRFADEICIDSNAGTYYVLQTNTNKNKGGKVLYWNPDSDSFNSWKEMKGVEALAIAVA